MSKNINRTGRVSSIDYASGTYEVTYWDRGKSVTQKINAQSNGVYKMPRVGDIVSVCHNSNGSEAGTTMGNIWNKRNRPAEGFKGLYRSEYGSVPGKAYSRYDENTGIYTQYVDKRTGRNCNGEIFDEAKGPITLVAGGSAQIKSSGGSVGLSAAQGMGLAAGKSVTVESGEALSLEAETEASISGETVEINASEAMTLIVNGAVIKIGAGGEIQIKSPSKITLSAPNIDIKGESGDVIINNISMIEHMHRSAEAGEKTSKPLP